ncbi:MAG: hypothetical protein Greene071436_405 [Parcubacteria group bacterium Greene0714_36]|nr:MAG: hypothetical protein Greene071436_405 [Parcubacteria group bacterium Greene0714_36]
MRKLITERGERLVMIEDGEPAVVVMSFAEYEKLAALPSERNGHTARSSAPVSEETLSLPSREDEWQIPDEPETEFIEEEHQPTSAVGLPRAHLDEIRLEDLPL